MGIDSCFQQLDLSDGLTHHIAVKKRLLKNYKEKGMKYKICATCYLFVSLSSPIFQYIYILFNAAV